MSQFRQDPTSRGWVLIAPNRAKRPEEFKMSAATMSLDLPEIDPRCVFCPGNEAKNLEITKFPNNKNWQVRIIPNKFEALAHAPKATHKQDFFVSRAGLGDHEVIITRKHNEPVALQSIQIVELSLRVLRQRFIDLTRHEHLAYAQIIHNHGREAGASIIHPHYQILATPMVPPGVQDEMSGAYHHHQLNGTCIYCEIIKEEQKLKERIVFETDDFIAYAPYASRDPFQVAIFPKEHSANFEEMTDKQMTQLAYVLKVTLGQIYVKLSDPPLNFYIHTLPFGHVKHLYNEKRSYHWHLSIFPRLAIWGGFEFATGIPINPVAPEVAAEYLK